MPVRLIPLNSLSRHPNNPRRVIDPEHVAELARSMAETGQWDPVMVRPLAGGEFQVISGHCRLEAARSLNWDAVRADVRELSDEQAAFLLLETNLKRRSLSEVEEAGALQHMMSSHGWSQAKAAERYSRTQQWVSLRLRLVTAAAEVQEAVTNHLVTATHGAHISQAPAEVQPAITRKVAEAHLSTRQTEEFVRVVMDPATPPDVKKAVLESGRMTPEHALHIAKLPTAIEREGFIKSVESGRLTPEQTAREVEIAIKPNTVNGERARRHLEVGKSLLKAREALAEIGGRDVAGLDAQALVTAEATIRNMGTRLQELLGWVTAAQGRQQDQQRGSGKLYQFPGGR